MADETKTQLQYTKDLGTEKVGYATTILIGMIWMFYR